MLKSIKANFNDLENLLPSSKSELSTGIYGLNMTNEGNNMFTYGNILSTDLKESIPYSNEYIRKAPKWLGKEGLYFTYKS